VLLVCERIKRGTSMVVHAGIPALRRLKQEDLEFEAGLDL
jgi:hypothetical protein